MNLFGHPHFTNTAGVSQRHPGYLLFVLVLIAAEFAWDYRKRSGLYDLKESAASLAIAGGRLAERAASAIVLAPVYLWVYAHRLFTIPVDGIATGLALFLVSEFFYYWFHRFSHTMRWMWASHSVHHSSTHLNLSSAYRLGWTDLFSGGWLIFLIPVWIGFSPVAFLALLGANLTFQFFLHTEAVRSLGPLEWLFNTPAHHRVHHAKNDSCLDKNYGGVLIVFDRLFGTFAAAPQDEPLQYGLAAKVPSYNPLKIAFGEWLSIGREIWNARSFGTVLRAAFGPP